MWHPTSCFTLKNRKDEKAHEIAGWRRETEGDVLHLPSRSFSHSSLSSCSSHAPRNTHHASRTTHHASRTTHHATQKKRTDCTITFSLRTCLFSVSFNHHRNRRRHSTSSVSPPSLFPLLRHRHLLSLVFFLLSLSCTLSDKKKKKIKQ